MGEYAIRISDGQKVKIGTCERMFYLRYDDRHKVRYLPGNVDPANEKDLFWRLPFEDEDKLEPGDYADHNRGLRLYAPNVPDNGYCKDYTDPNLIESPGTIQLHHPSGLLINVPCYHGEQLPDLGKDVKVFWNGKSWSYELVAVKNTDNGLLPIITCRHCRELWRETWVNILPYIGDLELRARLFKYAEISGETTCSK